MTAVADIPHSERIEALRRTKAEFTEEKIRTGGFVDGDDMGNIPWPDPIPFHPIPNHPDGGYYGIAACGENFRAWLAVHPVYIHPMSALAGAWVRPIPGSGWRPEDRPTHLRELHAKYNFVQTGIGAAHHFGGDLKIGLDLGWGGLLAKIRRYRTLNRPEDTSFYDGEEAVLLGIQEFIHRHADYARQQAASADHPFVRRNMLAIAEMNEHLIDHSPRTLRQACQFLVWFQTFDHMWGGGALGRLDRLLLPFYEADLAAGRIDDEEVIWCLVSQFFNDTHYSQIGGPSPDGETDQTNPVSFLILEAMHRARFPVNIAVRVHDRLDPELLSRAVRYLFEDGTGCSFVGSQGLDRGYGRNRPEIILNLFMHGTVERGLNATDGGVDIYNLSTDGVGLATVADSFAALEQRLDRERRLSWTALARHLEEDFADAEPVRLMLAGTPRFGAGDAPADEWAARIAELFTRLVRDSPTPLGYAIVPGLFSHGVVGILGKNLEATPNGRRAGAPISHSANPDPGFTPDGGSAPTAKSNAVARVQPRWGNTTPLQLDLDDRLARDLGGQQAVAALIKGHCDWTAP